MGAENALPPNWLHIPIGYNGRASSVVVSGTDVRRPWGQVKSPDHEVPAFQPSRRFDIELEMGAVVGQASRHGYPVTVAEADEMIFGYVLLNDWSARDIQAWEYQPLGPFLSKNFASTLSPWVVTLEALAPYRVPFAHPADEPQPLPYLDEPGNRAHGGIDVRLEVLLQTAQHRARGSAPHRLSATSFRHQYWTVAQMLTQHTVGGCNLQPGDLLGTGTISGPTPEEAGAIVELSAGGRQPIAISGSGETRTFLEDGDAVVLRGWCEAPGRARIGFGECRGEVLPALASVS